MAFSISLGPRSLEAENRARLPAHPWFVAFREGSLHVAFPEKAKDQEVARFCDTLTAFWQNTRGGTGLLIDFRRVRLVSAEQRQIFADFRKRVAPIVSRKVVAAAYVMDSALVRGVFAAVMLLRPPTYPYRVFPELTSAERWLAGQLASSAATAEASTVP
jgi:hypothetical protein